MKRTTLTALAFGIALVGLAVTACTEDPLEPASPAARPDDTSLSRGMDPDIIASVVGNGHFITDDVARTRVFSMRKYSDGTVDGWYHALRRGPGGANIRVRIECLHVVGNQAWANGTVVDAVDPANIGRPYALRFVDNGQGAGAMPDESGGARFQDFDCMDEPDLPLNPLTIGNLVVRGE